jgi:hypothetical protein
MLAMIIWVLALAAAIAGVTLTAALEAKSAHMAATAFVTIGIVAAAVNDHRAATLAALSPHKLAALASRYMGLLWAWSGVSAYVVYGFVLEWLNWVPVVFAMFVACVMYLFVGLILDREAVADVPDPRASRLIDFLTKSQFALAATLFGVLFALQRHPEFSDDGESMWVAINLAMGTAAGLLSLTGYLILHENRDAQADRSTVA